MNLLNNFTVTCVTGNSNFKTFTVYIQNSRHFKTTTNKSVKGPIRSKSNCTTYMYMLKVVNNTTRYKKNVYSRY